MADSVKVIVKDNQEQVSLWIGTNTGQWVDVANGIQYSGDVTINGHFEVDGDAVIQDELQVDGGIRSNQFVKYGGLSTEYLMADGSTSTGLPAGDGVITGDFQVLGDSDFQEVHATALSCEGLDSSGLANLDGGAKVFVTEYTDNADALAGGLSIGETYRTGDLMKIVH